MDWKQVTISTTAEYSDIVSVLLMEHGSDGVSVKDRRDVEEVLRSKKSWDYADETLLTLTDERVYVSGFFPHDCDLAPLLCEIEQLRSRAEGRGGSLETTISAVRDADWENEWRKYYEPIEIGEVAIVPKWLDYNGECATKVLMEPGMAFGTGKHETTAMCIKLLQELSPLETDVLDVGCGSGILGVCALKMGAKRCVMSDIDGDAVEFARENARINGVEERAVLICGDLTEKISGDFDVVLANLTADILLRLKAALPQYVRAGGNIIISGLIHARADEVLGAFLSDFRLVKRERRGEWQAMLLRKK